MMRRPFLPAPVRLLLVIVLAAVLSSAIDPYLHLGGNWAAQAVNAVVPVILVLLLWGVLGRAWLALMVEVVLLGVLRYADHMKVMYLNTDLVYADFTVLGGLLQEPQLVLGFLQPTAKKLALAIVVLIGAAVLGWFTWRQRPASARLRVASLALAVLGAVVTWTWQAPDTIPSLRWEVFQQAVGAQRVGIAGNLLLGRMTARQVERPPDPAAERAFWNEPLVRKARQRLAVDGSGLRPDIVVIQSESLFEPSQLCGFSDAPVLRHLAQQRPALAGNLRVPVFGGRTLQTEFEMLTGAPIAFYPGSTFAYYELMDHRVDALPRVLERLGYRTLAMHPSSRGYWRRGAVMPELGFDTFQDVGSFLYWRDFSDRRHVADLALSRAILAELDAAGGPTFVMAISMENHGPWGRFAPKDDTALGLPSTLTGPARAQLADYVAHAIDADNAYGFLIDALQRRGRPTVVMIYGDHLPALAAVYDQLCFKDGRPPQEHLPPYRVWANFPLPPPPDTTSAYLLQGWLMQAAGLPLEGHMLANALAGSVAHDPAASPAGRKRVLREYANIAAANVADPVPAPGAPAVFVGRDHALEMLMARRSTDAVAGAVTVRDNDLYLEPRPREPAQVAFDTNAAVASLTLRPYLDEPSAECRGTASRAAVVIEGDGRELYRAALAPRALRLATLDLRGVRRLTVRAEATGDARACHRVQLRVAQLLCYSARCNRPGPGLAEGMHVAESRILDDDPIEGDLLELEGMARADRPPATRAHTP